MKINEHKLIHAKDAGNGYHGRCEYCKVALVTDLGYCSWDGLKCVDREIEDYYDIPEDIRNYAQFHGLQWNTNSKIFVKPYLPDIYTLDELNKICIKLQN